MSLEDSVIGTESPITVAPGVGATIATSGGVVSLETLTVTTADVAWFPDVSVAIAVRSCEPSAAVLVFHPRL